MKLTAFLLLTVMLFICTPGRCQRVSISGKTLNLEQVFTEIRKQTGVEFFYPASLLTATRPVTLHVENKPIDEVLTTCLQGQGVGFNIRGKTVILFKEEEEDTTALIKGQVVDTRGMPVEMASVVLARTRAGTQTNRSGTFTIRINNKVQPGDSLHISFIGFKTGSVLLGNKTDLGQLVLQPADNALDETLIVAYGTTTERFRTGGITKVKTAEIEKTPALNVVEALAGRVPGLYVRQNNGNPGSLYNIQLRGFNVIPSTPNMVLSDVVPALSKPLFVIDGMPLPPEDVSDAVTVYGIFQNIGLDAMTGLVGAAGAQDPLYWLNPFDIESITVLKDAEATALYGSRAGNGVIMITTKKGKPGKASLNINFNTGINAQARRVKLMNTQEYVAMRHAAWDNTIRAGLPVRIFGGPPTYVPNTNNAYDLLVWDTTCYTNWQNELLGSAPVYNANISLSGGEGNTAYRLTGGYNLFKSSYPHVQGKNAFREEKGNMSFSVTSRSQNNRMKFSGSVMAATTGSRQPYGIPEDYIFMAPNAPGLFDEAGNINFTGWRAAGSVPNGSQGNPLGFLAKLYRNNRFTLLLRTSVSYELFRSLTATITTGYSRSDGKQTKTEPAAAVDPIERIIRRTATFTNSNSTGINVEPNLRYEIRQGRHHIKLLAGASYQADKQEGSSIFASGYISDELMGSPAGAPSNSPNSNFIQRKTISALGRISYRYADEFLIDLSGRRDGSSSFSAQQRYGNFGSIGWGWIFTQEAWSRYIPLLTFGKLRGSYGVTGSQNGTPYAYLSSFMPSSANTAYLPVANSVYSIYNYDGAYQGIPTIRIIRPYNSNLGWAQAVGLELGLDLYLLADQRLKLAAQWYRKTTGNQLVNHPVSAITGVSTTLVNLPAKVRNSGVEVTIDYSPPQRRNSINWYAHFNIAANRNKLHSYPGLEHSPFKNLYETGQPIVWQQLYTSYLDKLTGVYKVSDTINDPPVAYKVNNYPAYTGGLQFGISYKNFSISLSCVFARQKGFTNVQGAVYPGNLVLYGTSNQPVSVNGALHAAGQAANYAQLDRYWGDASYMAIKNATFSYDLPKALLKKIGIGELNFYVRSENLLMLPLSDYKGANPEQPGLLKQRPLRMVLVSGFSMNL